MLKYLTDKLGGLDLLIYSSGIGIVNKELDYDIEQKVNNLNVNGFTQVVGWGFNYFKNQGYGQISNISSVASEIGNGICPSYNASKAYQANYLQGLRFKAYRLKLPIKLIDVRPGFVDTDILQGNKDKLFWVSTVKKACSQIVEGIERCINASSNEIIRIALRRSISLITQGQELSKSLETSKVMPRLLISMIKIGEETGALSFMVENLANFYKREVDESVSVLTKAMEPAVIFVIAAIVGTIVVSLYLPMFGLIQNMGN